MKFSKNLNFRFFLNYEKNYLIFLFYIKMEKEIRDMAENRKAKYLKYFCGHGKYKYRCKSAKRVNYASMTDKNLTAKSAKEAKYASITDKSKPAKSAKEAKYASITDESKPAKSAEGPKYALITG